MIGEADGVPFVENGDHHLFEARMDEIFGNLPNNGVRDGSPCAMGLFVHCGGERLDISRRVGGLYLHNPWCAAQVVVESDAPHGVDEGIVEGSPLGSFVVKRSMLFHGFQDHSVLFVVQFVVSRIFQDIVTCFIILQGIYLRIS